jgi:hypothetical protein
MEGGHRQDSRVNLPDQVTWQPFGATRWLTVSIARRPGTVALPA